MAALCGEPRAERRSMYHLQPYLEEIDRVIEQGPYTDTWESLSAYAAEVVPGR